MNKLFNGAPPFAEASLTVVPCFLLFQHSVHSLADDGSHSFANAINCILLFDHSSALD